MDTTDSGTEESSTVAVAAESPVPIVLQVLPGLETGGVERGTVDITGAIVEAGWSAVVASSGGSMVREVERAGGTHVTLPLDSKNPSVMLGNVRRLRALIDAYKIDIVHARSRAPAWSARSAAKRAGVPLVTTVHGTYGESNRLKHVYNSIMARGERVIAISEFIGERVRMLYSVGPERLRVIHRGIDFKVFNPVAVSAERMIQLSDMWRLPDGIPVVLLPGRLTRWKGQEVLIEALARMGRKDVRCLLVGDDQGRTRYRQALENHVSRAGLKQVFSFAGDCRDMPAAYILADVVVSASTDPEAFGRVAVEAQALGRPVVATDHGAARETVVPGETGWLVPPGDPDALATALDQALALTTEEREALAKRAIAHVRARFDRERMCADTIAVYRELLDAAATGA